jgi:hypothetical protein
MTGLEYNRGISGPVFIPSDWAAVILWLGLFATMRRRNGFAALHDLVTGTRVIVSPSPSPRPLITTTPPTKLSGPARVGPYAVVEKVGELLLAHDPVLARDAWIRVVPPGTPTIDPIRRDVHRPTRLRWLNGRRAADENWDAFEAPGGLPTTTLLDKKQPWSAVRFWLLDLAEEMTAGIKDGTLPPEIGVDRLYLTNDGRTLLLEFPAPRAVPSEPRTVSDAQEMQEFLSQLADEALPARIPLHAREFLDALAHRRLEAPAQIAGNLRELSGKPAVITRQRRLFSIALITVVALALSHSHRFHLGLVARSSTSHGTANIPTFARFARCSKSARTMMNLLPKRSVTRRLPRRLLSKHHSG